MTEATRVRRNTLFSFFSISSRLIANVIVFWIIARFYGPTLFGQFAFAHTLATIFIISADFGFDILLTNEIARNRNKAVQFFRQFFSLKFIFTSVSIIGMWLFAILGNLSSDSRLFIAVFSLYMAFTTLTNFLFALFKGFERLEYETKVSLFINVSLLIIVAILIFLNSSILNIAYAFLLTRFIGFIVGIKYSFAVLKNISFKPLFTEFKENKNKILIYGFHLVFSYLFFQLDTILLAMWRGDYEVGIYQSVFKLILIPLVIPEIFVNTLLPVLSRLNVENLQSWRKVGNLMNKILFIVILPISITLFVFADKIINIIYGSHNYVDAIPVLRIFALTLFVRFNLETYALMITTSDRQKTRLYVVIFATLLNLLLNYFIIPLYGAFGAAIVSLITNALVGAIYILTTLPLFYDWIINVKMIFTLIISIALTFVLWFLNSIILLLFSPILIGIFFVIAYLFVFSKEEKKLIFSNEFKLPAFILRMR